MDLERCYLHIEMRTIKAQKTLEVPEGVTVAVKSRIVTVKGKRGTITRNFQHLPIDLHLENKGKLVVAELWFGERRGNACIRTLISHIKNMMTGVTKGYLYKMRLVYNHFPITVNIENKGKSVEVRNYLGEKIVRKVEMMSDTVCVRTDVKDEISLSGIDVDAVSQSAANIQQISRMCTKDIRKFLDGVYVSYRGHIEQEL